MTINSKYFDSISIKAKKKAKKPEPKHPCSYKGCEKKGAYKAPSHGSNPRVYVYFCLEHVREYNKNFNFFSELSPEKRECFLGSIDEAAAPILEASEMPTPKTSEEFANIRSGSAAYHKRIGNKHKLYGISNEKVQQRKLTTLEIAAFETLDLPADSSVKTITTKYKQLIKINHPDSNGGDRSFEAKLNAIIQAYKTLKKGGLC